MILAATPQDIELFGRMIQYRPTAGARGIKLLDGSEVQAMVTYDNWTPSAAQMHIWIGEPRAFNRTFIREAFTYLFHTCGRQLAVGVTPGDNHAALDFNRRIGFVEKYRVIDGWEPGVDMVLQELRAGDCKWLRGYGRLPAAGASRPTSHQLEVVNG